MMRNEEFYVAHLDKYGIKATAMRLLILRQLFVADEMVSLPALAAAMPTVDKSTISRTLALFRRQGLIRALDDGSGATKYDLCDDEGAAADGHIHFRCTSCHRTFCFKDMPVPYISLPYGFQQTHISYVAEGLCPTCTTSRRHEK